MSPARPVATYGLTHIALAVRDPQRSLRFYRAVLGARPVYQAADFVQVQTPGTRAVRAIRAAGGTISSQGEFIPGEPYVFFKDPDGYEVEIWYELPTAFDPGRKRRRPALVP